nr:type II toxin-antitoxin system RelE/ParE family toxin [Photobacterium damselae]
MPPLTFDFDVGFIHTPRWGYWSFNLACLGLYHRANLGPPHTDSMGDGLFEIRAKAQEGVGRGLFCYLKGQHVYVLRAFMKKTNKTPKKEIELARERMKEVKL